MSALPHWPLRGVLLGCCGAFLFTLQDAAFKLLMENFAVAQVIFMRSVTTLFIAAIWVRRAGGKALRVGRPRLFALSFAANITAWFCFYTGLSMLPLTVAICVFFLVPVMIAILSIPVLGEKPTWRQGIGLLCGFAGVFVITNPLAASGFNLIAVGWILASVFLWALTAVTTRALEPFMTVGGTLLYSTVGFLAVSGAFLPFVWRTPPADIFAAMLLLGVVSAGAQSCVWAAYRSARSAVVAVSEYSALVWAALLGWLLWDERQGAREAFGIALIVAAGLVVLWRARQKVAHHM